MAFTGKKQQLLRSLQENDDLFGSLSQIELEEGRFG